MADESSDDFSDIDTPLNGGGREVHMGDDDNEFE